MVSSRTVVYCTSPLMRMRTHFESRSDESENRQTVLSKDPEANFRPSQLHATEWTLALCGVYSRTLGLFRNLDRSEESSEDSSVAARG